MSSRRKKAPPVRVDEEAKEKLNWNMLDDRKNEVILVDDEDQTLTCSSLPSDPTPSSSSIFTTKDNTEDECSSSVQFTEELPSTSSEVTGISVSLTLSVVPASKLCHVWRALIGEFSVRPAWLPSDCKQKSFTLHRIGEQLCLSYSSCEESPGLQLRPDEDTCTAECSLSRIPLEDLDWMQKRRVVQLCHQVKEDLLKVQIPSPSSLQSTALDTHVAVLCVTSCSNLNLSKDNTARCCFYRTTFVYLIPTGGNLPPGNWAWKTRVPQCGKCPSEESKPTHAKADGIFL